MAGPIFGDGDPALAERRFCGLFGLAGGLWSFDVADVAIEDQSTVGVIGHYPRPIPLGREVRTFGGALRVYGVRGTGLLFWRLRHLVSARPAEASRAYCISNLAVAKHARGRGIGTTLMQHAHEAARSSGAKNVGLEVLVDNTSAIRLYERHGYAERGRRLSKGLQRMTGSPGLLYMERAVRDSP
jgi:ribosomal protein S18 acetylase RimI-like enzyme